MEPNPRWFLQDAYWQNEGNGKFCFNLYSDPVIKGRCAIHDDSFAGSNELRIKIRQWISRMIPDTVIISEIDKSYRVYYGESSSWEHSHDRRNKFMVFHFEEESSAIMFKLAFGEHVVPVTADHPKKDPEEKRTVPGWDGFHGLV